MDDRIAGRRALDFFLGILFAALGAFVLAEGLRAYGAPLLATVPRASNPGGTTAFIGAVLIVLGLGIAVIGFRGTGGKPFSVAAARLPATLKGPRFFRGLLALGLIAVYFFILWPNLPFWLSTPLYLLATMALFKAGAWWKILMAAGLTTGLVYYVFAVLAFVPLP